MKKVTFTLLLVLMFTSICFAEGLKRDYDISYNIYFGLGNGVNSVTETEFNKFLDDTVSSALPEGFTILKGGGQWKSDKGVIKETTYLVHYQIKKNRLNEKIVDELCKTFVKNYSKAENSCYITTSEIKSAKTFYKYD